MNQLEYIILDSAVRYHENFRNILFDWRLPCAEVAIAANRLFQNGDILAVVLNDDGNDILDVVLTMPEIQAYLEGKLRTSYYLTPQGGARWEAVANPNWNQYFRWLLGSSSSKEYKESSITCSDRRLVEQMLEASEYVVREVPIPGTENWELIESWPVTYWKTLPQAYSVRYQIRDRDWYITPNTPRELIEKEKQVNEWYYEIRQWYVEPKLPAAPPDPMDYMALNYYTPPSKISIQKAEYLLLREAVIMTGSLRGAVYSCKLSYAEVAKVADSLFQRGYILAEVYDECDNECGSSVILTKTGIQDSLNDQLQAYYYLTPSGGAYWESMAHPNWDKFLGFESLDSPRTGKVIGATREIIEELLALNPSIGLYKQIPGTEVWEINEPWQATYWKTLLKGYKVSYETQPNQLVLDYLHEKESAPREFVKRYQEARQLHNNIRKWYSDPEFD